MDKPTIILLLLLSLLFASKGTSLADETSPAVQPIRDRLAKAARHFLGLPYRWGGMSSGRGMDCSGLMKVLFARFHVELPRTSREQFHIGESVAIDNLQSGDLLFFATDGKTPNHVGVYIGDRQFVHAEKKAGQVIITSLSQPWYAARLIGARRVKGLWRAERSER